MIPKGVDFDAFRGAFLAPSLPRGYAGPSPAAASSPPTVLILYE